MPGGHILVIAGSVKGIGQIERTAAAEISSASTDPTPPQDSPHASVMCAARAR